VHGTLDATLADHQAQTWLWQVSVANEQQEGRPADTKFGLVKQGLEISGSKEAVVTAKGVGGIFHRETLLGTASSKDWR
jgi:hypothetical protein